MMASGALTGAREKLKHLETPDLDNEVLLSHVLKKPREHVLMHPEETLDEEHARAFDALIARRAEHEPIAYLTRHKEFYGRDFYVDERVHIPRSATEDLVDAVKRELPGQFDGTLADIGTGSGCIAVTLALEFPNASIIATDISKDALDVAKRNAHGHNVASRIAFRQGSLGEPMTKRVDVIAANLPYGWKDGWTDDREVFFQPEISYLSSPDGLGAISELIKQLPGLLNKNGRAYLEFDPRQGAAIKKLAREKHSAAVIIKDASGFDRILALTK